MMGREVGGRGRPHGEESSRFEEKERRSGWGVASPSRHLWVGNLSHHMTQSALSEQFLRFGDIDNISYIPGRNFAFVNYRKQEDAIIAMRELQGYSVAGMSLRIEFAKGVSQDRASMLPQAEEEMHYNDARHLAERVESLSRRDSRQQRPSPEKSHDKSKSNRNAEPSEMLWIGFPTSMSVDELALRRAFQPFGEIEKISTFPGRSYAFVRFRSIVEACRAKEALQGKLFNNPCVSICFAKGENSAEQGRGSTSAYFPHLRPNFHPGVSGQGGLNFQREKSFESPIRELHMLSPGFVPNSDLIHRDANIMGVGRSSSRAGAGTGPVFGGTFDLGRLQDLGSERRMLEDPYKHHRDGPTAEKNAPWLDFSFDIARRPPSFEDSRGVDKGSFPLGKKLKTDSFPDNELPEFPFSDLEQEKCNTGPSNPFPPEQHTYGFDTAPFCYKGFPDHQRNIIQTKNESTDSWRNVDSPSSASGPPFLDKLQRINSEPRQPPRTAEWKWEGTIAKGGTAVCRARCFPVGKVLDFMLPEFLNCTARTGLDMLAKHYYQAASTWVVFFVPETDADINFYNEFMNYLGEKQRAAVAKLDEKVSLFLVPPSEFSEQVLKVPGKVSISGVILKFQQASSSFSSLENRMEAMESKPPSVMYRPNDGTISHRDTSFLKQSSPEFRPVPHGLTSFGPLAGHLPQVPSSFPPPPKPNDNLYPMHKVPDFHKESRHEFQQHNASFPSNYLNNSQVSSPGFGTFPPPVPNAPSRSFDNSKAEEYPLTDPRVSEGRSSTSYVPETSGTVMLPSGKFSQQQQESKPQVSSASQLSLQPDQLAHLAALLGQRKQSENPSLVSAEYKQSNVPLNPTSQTQASLAHALGFPYGSQPLVGLHHINQPQQVKEEPSSALAVQHPTGNAVQQISQQASTSNREETEADPQKRLQATLQLAAALLQQIQQQGKT